MKVADAITGFYAVLDRDDEELARTLLGSGAKVLQIRIKPDVPPGAGELVRIARLCRTLCDAAGAALIVNDRIDVALAAGADGVHLGQTDLGLRDARRIVGDRLWIGVSTHNLAQVTLARAVATGTIINDDLVTNIPMLDMRGLLGLLLLIGLVGGLSLRRR